MAFKTITIKEDVYNQLLTLKRKNESFSELFQRLSTEKKNLRILKELSESQTYNNKEELLKDIQTKRSQKRGWEEE